MSDWITLHDSEWTPEQITPEIASRARAREDELGPLELNIPSFKYPKRAPQPPANRPYNAELYNHLKRLNEMPSLEPAPVLEESPVAQTPWMENVLGRIRGQFHALVLFYVNRAARQQSQLNDELIAALNELTIAIEEQQEQNQPSSKEFPQQKESQEEA